MGLSRTLLVAAFAVALSACDLLGEGKVEPIIKTGPARTSLEDPDDQARVSSLLPAEGSYVNRITSVELAIKGSCISGSTAVLVSVVNTDISLTLECSGQNGEFSGVIDVSDLPDGEVQIVFWYLKDTSQDSLVYEVTRVINKDTVKPKEFAIPSTFTESPVTRKISFDAVEGADYYHVTFTPDGGGGAATGPLEVREPAVVVSSLTYDTNYVVSVVAFDAAGNNTAASNTGTFLKLDIDPPEFTSLPLANAAADGYINQSESGSGSPLAGSLVASGYDPAQTRYAAGLSGTDCSAMAYSSATVPVVSDLTFNDTYKVCVRLKDSAGNTSYGSTGSIVVDTAVPTPGNFGNFLPASDTTSSGFTVKWVSASDSGTSASSLQYLVCVATLADTVNSVASCEANALMDWTAGVTSYAVTVRNAATIYYFNVVVRDAAANKKLYNWSSKATSAGGGGGGGGGDTSGGGSTGGGGSEVNHLSVMDESLKAWYISGTPGGAYTAESVTGANTVGVNGSNFYQRYTSVALDASNQPYLAWWQKKNGENLVDGVSMSRKTSSWATPVVQDSGLDLSPDTLAGSAPGQLFLSGGAASGIMHAFYRFVVSLSVELRAARSVGLGAPGAPSTVTTSVSSIASVFDAANERTHVAWFDNGTTTIKYSNRTVVEPFSTASTLIDAATICETNNPTAPGIALGSDANKTVYITFTCTSGTIGGVVKADSTSSYGSWTTIKSATKFAKSPSMSSEFRSWVVVDSSANVHMIWFRATDINFPEDLMYSKCSASGASCTWADPVVVVAKAAANDKRAEFPRIGLNSSGYLRIYYLDTQDSHKLKLVYEDASHSIASSPLTQAIAPTGMTWYSSAVLGTTVVVSQ